jgi:hypothetical protein
MNLNQIEKKFKDLEKRERYMENFYSNKLLGKKADESYLPSINADQTLIGGTHYTTS